MFGLIGGATISMNDSMIAFDVSNVTITASNRS